MRNPSAGTTGKRGSGTATPCCSKVGIKRGPWTAEEDEILGNYVRKEGEGKWRTMPKRAGLARCGKSCRLRWMNYLRPSVKRGKIGPDEEDLILRLHRLLGNRWSLIAGRIPGRTDNEIKNFWNSHLSKKLINQGIDPRTHKPLNLTCYPPVEVVNNNPSPSEHVIHHGSTSSTTTWNNNNPISNHDTNCFMVPLPPEGDHGANPDAAAAAATLDRNESPHELLSNQQQQEQYQEVLQDKDKYNNGVWHNLEGLMINGNRSDDIIRYYTTEDVLFYSSFLDSLSNDEVLLNQPSNSNIISMFSPSSSAHPIPMTSPSAAAHTTLHNNATFWGEEQIPYTSASVVASKDYHKYWPK